MKAHCGGRLVGYECPGCDTLVGYHYDSEDLVRHTLYVLYGEDYGSSEKGHCPWCGVAVMPLKKHFNWEETLLPFDEHLIACAKYKLQKLSGVFVPG